MKHKRPDNRRVAVLPVKRPGNILIPFHKRAMLPMKSCPDCKATGILALNGMFGCARWRRTLLPLRVEFLLMMCYDRQMTTTALTANAVTERITASGKDKPLKFYEPRQESQPSKA